MYETRAQRVGSWMSEAEKAAASTSAASRPTAAPQYAATGGAGYYSEVRDDAVVGLYAVPAAGAKGGAYASTDAPGGGYAVPATGEKGAAYSSTDATGEAYAIPVPVYKEVAEYSVPPDDDGHYAAVSVMSQRVPSRPADKRTQHLQQGIDEDEL